MLEGDVFKMTLLDPDGGFQAEDLPIEWLCCCKMGFGSPPLKNARQSSEWKTS